MIDTLRRALKLLSVVVITTPAPVAVESVAVIATPASHVTIVSV